MCDVCRKKEYGVQRGGCVMCAERGCVMCGGGGSMCDVCWGGWVLVILQWRLGSIIIRHWFRFVHSHN